MSIIYFTTVSFSFNAYSVDYQWTRTDKYYLLIRVSRRIAISVKFRDNPVHQPELGAI